MGMTMSLTAEKESTLRAIADDVPRHIELIFGGGENTASLEKMWHAVHLGLTGNAYGGSWPANFLLSDSGTAVGEDTGFGSPKLFDAEQTRQIADILRAMPLSDFQERTTNAKLAASEIYPMVWDEPADEIRSEIDQYLDEVRRIVELASQNGWSLLVTLA